MLTFFSFKRFLIYLITSPDIFLNKTDFVRLGIFHLELGKKTSFLALGMGPNFGPNFRRSRALDSVKSQADLRHGWVHMLFVHFVILWLSQNDSSPYYYIILNSVSNV